MKPKILHCAYSGLGGHVAFLFTLLDAGTRDDFDHFVLFYGVEDLCEEYAQACERLGIPYRFIKKQGKADISGHREVLKTIGQQSPDVVLINGTPLAIPILLHRALTRQKWKVIVRESQANHCKSRIEWAGSFTAARLADAVVYLTPEFRQEVDERLPFTLTRRGEVHVIPNGVDLADYPDVRKSDSESFRISMVSRLVPIKDYETLIEAIHILRSEHALASTELHIAGDGSMLANLKQQVSNLGLQDNVTFHGMLGKDEVIALLASSHLYAHCTLGEGMSNSILQAMAAGLPIVASDVLGVSNLIRHEVDGVLVPPKDAVALADVIESLVRAPEARRRLSENARRRIEKEYSRERVTGEYSRLFDRLVKHAGERERVMA